MIAIFSREPTRILVYALAIQVNFASLMVATTYAQQISLATLPAGIPLLNDEMPPGVIGAIQLQRQPNLQGFFQPVEIRGPEGSTLALASDGHFQETAASPARAALLVGPVYRFHLSSITDGPEVDLFPTLEVIDRTYPPSEREHRFPIIVTIDEFDVQSAIEGNLVTKVIYLEDSSNASPENYSDGNQRVFEIGLNEDTLRTADYYGRPVAILRIGSLVPDLNSDFLSTAEGEAFLFGSPPWLPIKKLPVGKTLSDASNNQ